MDLELLQTFLIVAEAKSFTEAGSKVKRTQSAISLQIQKLENYFGKSLFERNNRQVLLTASGEKLLVYARQMLKLKQDMLNSIKEESVEGPVNIGIPEDFATVYLPEILASFTNLNPKVTLSVNCDLTLHLIHKFNKHEYDLILIKQDPDHPIDSSRLIWREPLVWVGSHTKVIDWKKSSSLPLVLSPEPCVYRRKAIESLSDHKIPWHIVYSSQSLAGNLAAVKAGLGVTILPVNMIPSGLKVFRKGDFPKLKDIEFSLLLSEKSSKAACALYDYIFNHV